MKQESTKSWSSNWRIRSQTDELWIYAKEASSYDVYRRSERWHEQIKEFERANREIVELYSAWNPPEWNTVEEILQKKKAAPVSNSQVSFLEDSLGVWTGQELPEKF